MVIDHNLSLEPDIRSRAPVHQQESLYTMSKYIDVDSPDEPIPGLEYSLPRVESPLLVQGLAVLASNPAADPALAKAYYWRVALTSETHPRSLSSF